MADYHTTAGAEDPIESQMTEKLIACIAIGRLLFISMQYPEQWKVPQMSTALQHMREIALCTSSSCGLEPSPYPHH